MFYPDLNRKTHFQLATGEMGVGLHIGNRHSQVVSCSATTLDSVSEEALIQIPSVISWGQDQLNSSPESVSSNQTTFYDSLWAFASPEEEELSLAGICRKQAVQIGCSPTTLLTALIKELIGRAEERWQRRVAVLFLAVPDYFSDEQLQAWVDIAKAAGEIDVYLIPRDGACMTAFGSRYLRSPETSKTLLYHFGDTHCTVSLAEYTSGGVKVLERFVNTEIGGRFFTRQLLNYWEQINDLSPGYFSSNPERFLTATLTAYEAQDQIRNTFLYKKILPGPVNAQVSLEKYNELVNPMVEASIDFTRQCLIALNILPTDIDDLIMTGGVAQMPLVQIALSRLCEKATPHLLSDFPLAAYGAALLGKTMITPDLVK